MSDPELTETELAVLRWFAGEAPKPDAPDGDVWAAIARLEYFGLVESMHGAGRA